MDGRRADTSKAERILHRRLDRAQGLLPDAAGRWLGWLRRPGARAVRIPLALLLVAGGCLGFLPVLGFWMVPLGLALLALDVPPLRRPVARAMVAGARLWRRVRRWWAGAAGTSPTRP